MATEFTILGVRSGSPSSTKQDIFKPPSKATLKKYGFGSARVTPDEEYDSPEEDWLALLASQGNVCPVCKKAPTTGRWVTDHEHVRGWKDMTPIERRKYVRGITCWFCNSTYLGRAMNLKKARAMVEYLESYERRRDGT